MLLGRIAPTAAAAAVTAASLRPLLLNPHPAPPLLFSLHVAAMSPMLPLAAAALTAVRARLQKPLDETVKPTRARLQRLVRYHLLGAASAFYLALGGALAIFAHKHHLGRPHFTRAHSRLGLLALALWGGAYLVAQAHVWRDVLRARPFRFVYEPRLVWASRRHRKFGAAAVLASVGAIGTGLDSAWARVAMGPLVSRACVATTLVLGALLLEPSARGEWRASQNQRTRRAAAPSASEDTCR